MKNTLFISLVLIFATGTICGQENSNISCKNSLTRANDAYENGNFEEAIELLTHCLKAGNLNNQMKDAYRILAYCYLEQDKDSLAEEAIHSILKLDHSYQEYPYLDTKEFTKIVTKFEIKPMFMLGIRTGINYSLPCIQKAYSVKSPTKMRANGKFGSFIEFIANYQPKNNRYMINGFLGVNSISFSQNLIFNSDSIEKLSYLENINNLNLGLEIRYNLLKQKKIVPYFGFGMCLTHMLKGISNIVYVDYFDHLYIEKSSRILTKTKTFNKNVLYSIFDFGFKTKLKGGYLGVGVVYNQALTARVNAKNRFVDFIDFNIKRSWVDSDINLNSMNLYFTYSIPLSYHIYKKVNSILD